MNSLKQSLKAKLKKDKYASRVELRNLGELWNYDVSNVDRQLRSLTAEGLLIPKKKLTNRGAHFIEGYYWYDKKIQEKML